MYANISERDENCIIQFTGKLDLNVALTLEAEIIPFIETFNKNKIIFDILQGDYISASIMHLFLSVEEKAKEHSIECSVLCSDTVKKIFNDVGITSFRIYNNLEEALCYKQ